MGGQEQLGARNRRSLFFVRRKKLPREFWPIWRRENEEQVDFAQSHVEIPEGAARTGAFPMLLLIIHVHVIHMLYIVPFHRITVIIAVIINTAMFLIW